MPPGHLGTLATGFAQGDGNLLLRLVSFFLPGTTRAQRSSHKLVRRALDRL
jgi:hypothetical protein